MMRILMLLSFSLTAIAFYLLINCTNGAHYEFARTINEELAVYRDVKGKDTSKSLRAFILARVWTFTDEGSGLKELERLEIDALCELSAIELDGTDRLAAEEEQALYGGIVKYASLLCSKGRDSLRDSYSGPRGSCSNRDAVPLLVEGKLIHYNEGLMMIALDDFSVTVVDHLILKDGTREQVVNQEIALFRKAAETKGYGISHVYDELPPDGELFSWKHPDSWVYCESRDGVETVSWIIPSDFRKAIRLIRVQYREEKRESFFALSKQIPVLELLGRMEAVKAKLRTE